MGRPRVGGRTPSAVATARRGRVSGSAYPCYEELADPIPTRVPAIIATVPVGEPVPVDISGTGWSLRLCRIEAPGDEWVDWAPFLTADKTAAALERRRKRR